MEVSFETGDAVVEQNLEWAKQLQKQLSPKQLQQMITADARLDVAHFERVEAGAMRKPKPAADGPRLAADPASDESLDDQFFGDGAEEDFDEDAAMEMFDPTCLLTVVEALSHLTHGLAFDPAAGEIL